MAGLGAALAVTIAACVVEPRRGADWGPVTEVHWAGQQRAAVRGDVAAKVRLAELDATHGLCAIGPMEGMRGEIIVVEGRAAISRVRDGGVQVEAVGDAGAAFLVWIEAPVWREVPLPDGVRDDVALEAFLPDAIAQAGLDASAPAAFRVDGTVGTLAFHVLDMRETARPGPESHEASKRRFALQDASVHVVGFRSSAHRGVFTPPGSDWHAHFVTEDGQVGGHVESFTLRSGAKLRVAGRAAAFR